MTPLRQRMLEDMQIRNLAASTQRAYVEHVSRFARHFGRSPAVLGPEDIRAYLVYLTTERHFGAQHGHHRGCRTPLPLPWSVEAVIPAPKTPRTLPVALSPAEVMQFLECVKAPKHRTILTTCYAAGLRISEAVRLTLPAIDSQRMVLRIEQGKGQKRSLHHALADIADHPARLVAEQSLHALALPWRSPRRSHHHPCGEPRLPESHRCCGIPKQMSPYCATVEDVVDGVDDEREARDARGDLERFIRVFPNHRVVELPDADHFFFEDAAERIVEEMRAFLTALDATSTPER
jgi:hypothetical protein